MWFRQGRSYAMRILSSLEVAVLSEDFERDAHGIGPEEEQNDSGEELPAAKELKLVLEVSGIAGLSCDRQEGKLADALGQIVAKKHGKGIKSSAGYVGASNLRVRDNCILNEA
jgi:hypothetical protein